MSNEIEPLEIVCYPDPRLLAANLPIDEIDDGLKELVERMFETMYRNRGVGLAGPQVGVNRRILTLNISGQRNEGVEYVLINPEILDREGEEVAEEGCLSFPGVRAKIKRPERLRAAFTDLDGNRRECEVEGLFARAIEHECDHLEGMIFVQRMSPTQKFLVKGQLKDLEHEFTAKQKKSGNI